MIARVLYFVVSAALLLGFVVIVVTGGQLIATGSAAAVGIGICAEVLVALGCWFLWKTYRFGRRSGQLARLLEAEGGLPVDELERTAAGRRGDHRAGAGRLARLVPAGCRLCGRPGHAARPQGHAAGDQAPRRTGVAPTASTGRRGETSIDPVLYSRSCKTTPPRRRPARSPVGRSPCRS
jgi:hypothetical protein